MRSRLTRLVSQALALGLGLALASRAVAVDGVIEINTAKALAGGVTTGDTPGFPVTISESGSYRLTGNLTVSGGDPSTTSGIVVTASLNVTSIVETGATGPVRSGVVPLTAKGTTRVVKFHAAGPLIPANSFPTRSSNAPPGTST